MSLSRSVMGRHCFYVYYDGEQYFHDLHGLSYGGESVKKKFIQLKCKTHLRKMHQKIMEALGLDKESHKISIVYRAPQLLVNTQVVYNSNSLCGDAEVDMMWAVIKRTLQFIASDLYVTIEAIGFHDGANSQHASGVEEPRSGYLHVQPSFADAMPLPYNTEPCSAVDHLDSTELLGATQTHDVGGSTHAYEHVQAYMDRGIDIDASRDVYEEFIDTDGPVDETEVLDGTQLKDNEEDCPITAIPGWFTSNTWDNINDPSPALGPEELTSWHKGDQLAKGMLFKNKASVQYMLTLYSVEHNKQYKVRRSKYKRHGLFFPVLIHRFLKYLGLRNFPSQEVVHIQAPIGTKFLKQRSAQKKFGEPNVGSSKRPRVQSTTGDDVPYEDMHGDPTAVVVKDGDDEVDVETTAAAQTGPPPPSLRAMMETIMTTQATHGQVLYGLLGDIAALRADVADFRRQVPPSPSSDSS
nr:hypothetical protein CFP56_78187 [Quercus suber]